jgi:4-diphosphocytidyl-2-C-methyl-D-erythritol kinase
METLRLDSPAKINLRLEIIKKREDGYHELKTVLQKISLHDTLHFSLRNEKGIVIESDHPDLPTGRTNLVYKAIQSIMRESDYQGGIHVGIEKRIPLGAGLGGGSSDAATTLKAIANLLKLDFSQKKLMEMGLGIGADVPFFFLEGSAIGSGIGERLKKIDLPTLWYVLIYPNFEVSTRWAYQNFVLTRSTAIKPRALGGGRSLCSGSTLSKPQHLWGVEGLTNQRIHCNLYKFLNTPEGFSHMLFNHLEALVSKKYPQIGIMEKILLSTGALGTLMTGSGPTVFGLFQDEKSSVVAYSKIKKLVARRGWIVFKAHSIP